MLALLILIISAGALFQFFLAYCRSLLRTYAKVEVSENVRQVSGFDASNPSGKAFPELVQLLDLHPKRGDDRVEIASIRAYHVLLKLVCLLARLSPEISYWITAEQEDCAHFAAVSLDRRLASWVSDLT